MSDKTKTDFLEEHSISTGEGRHSIGLNSMLKAMQAYADQELKKPNEFIQDIAKLLGEDGLGFDGISWTVDDFKTAIDQEKRKDAIAFQIWVREGKYRRRNGVYYSPFVRGASATDEGLYDLYLQTK